MARVRLVCGPSRTKQSFKDECNIHTIMERYHKTGLVTHLNATRPKFGDFSTVPDYKKALDVVGFAAAQFKLLPASIRDRFQNDPVQLLGFLEDPRNREEAVKLGIVEPIKEPKAPDAPEAGKPAAPAIA